MDEFKDCDCCDEEPCDDPGIDSVMNPFFGVRNLERKVEKEDPKKDPDGLDQGGCCIWGPEEAEQHPEKKNDEGKVKPGPLDNDPFPCQEMKGPCECDDDENGLGNPDACRAKRDKRKGPERKGAYQEEES